MAYLVEVFRLDDHPPLKRRQSPLMIEDHLMMVMDLNNLDLVKENMSMKNKDLEDFLHKYNFLSAWELRNALQITIKDVINILNESIPCVGCRRSVERLYYQLIDIGEMALDPLQVKPDGMLVFKDELLNNPRSLCSIFSDHNERLINLVDSQPRSKKSRRCVLHSWDLQKSRPVTPAWKDVWAVMHEKCKAEVLLIDFSMLLSKLENFLKKHRFCADCRTKVMKAYNLLVADCDPSKEKGFVPALYQKIKRCLPGKHIHLPTETKYIDSLIARAEPELLGNRRERHAKTMEIAQEEVLTCVGICIYDRLHRIYLRLREEEFTCRVLAAAAVEALCRKFETFVEKKRGISRLELLCEEISKAEHAKQLRKEMKKLKKKRKKVRRSEAENDEKDSCECESEDVLDQQEEENSCECPKVKPPVNGDRHKLQILDRKSKGQVKCLCEDCSIKNRSESDSEKTSQPLTENKSKKGNNNKSYRENCKTNCSKKNKTCDGGKRTFVENNNAVECHNSMKNSLVAHCQLCQSAQKTHSENLKKMAKSGSKQRGRGGDHSQDCGYSSEHNNGDTASSSLNSSPEGSEVACSDGFCEHEGDCNLDRNVENHRSKKHQKQNGHFSFLLEEMLEKSSLLDEEEEECFIPAEEIQAFRAKMPLVDEKRLQLRQILRNRFAQLCNKSQVSKV
ncbi:UNVERIFIED_CONTAM: hypothetical protein PYX00_005051 [Menopon gallinae]|uniref:Gametogenetin-binding protein 2 n=1 Tax=Menopon gallinae TaxID=328185 RepID=A0AAW2HQX1_9NEOP